MCMSEVSKIDAARTHVIPGRMQFGRHLGVPYEYSYPEISLPTEVPYL